MLRSVRFKNFVQFREYQVMDFSSDGPFIFIGENGSGKSSVLEGIRRCLKLELSTSISSVFDSKEMSYFICIAENDSGSKENVIFGTVSIPQAYEQDKNTKDENEIQNAGEKMDFEPMSSVPERRKSETRKMSIDEELPFHQLKRQKSSNTEITTYQNIERYSTIASVHSTEECKIDPDFKDLIGNSSNQSNNMRYYKFAMKGSDDSMFIDLIESTKMANGESNLFISKSYMVSNAYSSDARKLFLDTSSKHTVVEHNIEACIKEMFGNLEKSSPEHSTKLETLLKDLTKQFVFTFPLRSIGPLQWSESDRISFGHREENYKEAENRCEIIKYFLKDEQEINFDINIEQKYFQQLTQCKEYNFKLIDGKIHLSKGKFALLKTPEGILEAKAFSILISSKHYKTIILEEPDRGMHPQLVERMILIMKQKKNDKRVLLTTHHKGFITPWTVPDTFIFRRFETETTTEYRTGNQTENRVICGNSIFDREESVANMKQMRLVTSHHVPDMFFARKVLFYEGESEDLFLRELKRQILTGEHSEALKKLYGNDEEVAKGLVEYTFIKMNSKDNRKLYQMVSKNLMLDHLFLVDRDAVSGILGRSKGEMEMELKSKEYCKIIREKLLKEERTFFWLDGDIENMVTTMCDNDIKGALKVALQRVKVISKIDKPHDGVSRSRIDGKLFLHAGIRSNHIIEGVRHILDHYKPEDDLAEFINLLTRKT